MEADKPKDVVMGEPKLKYTEVSMEAAANETQKHTTDLIIKMMGNPIPVRDFNIDDMDLVEASSEKMFELLKEDVGEMTARKIMGERLPR